MKCPICQTQKFFNFLSLHFIKDEYNDLKVNNFIGCDKELMELPSIRKIITNYRLLCRDILSTFDELYPSFERHNFKLVYGLLVPAELIVEEIGDHGEIYGAIEVQNKNNLFCTYINPNTIPFAPCKKSFNRIFSTAKHEMTHLLLHLCVANKDIRYTIGNNIHDDTFNAIMDDLEQHYHDRTALMKRVCKG